MPRSLLLDTAPLGSASDSWRMGTGGIVSLFLQQRKDKKHNEERSEDGNTHAVEEQECWLVLFCRDLDIAVFRAIFDGEGLCKQWKCC